MYIQAYTFPKSCKVNFVFKMFSFTFRTVLSKILFLSLQKICVLWVGTMTVCVTTCDFDCGCFAYCILSWIYAGCPWILSLEVFHNYSLDQHKLTSLYKYGSMMYTFCLYVCAFYKLFHKSKNIKLDIWILAWLCKCLCGIMFMWGVDWWAPPVMDICRIGWKISHEKGGSWIFECERV